MPEKEPRRMKDIIFGNAPTATIDIPNPEDISSMVLDQGIHMHRMMLDHLSMAILEDGIKRLRLKVESIRGDTHITKMGGSYANRAVSYSYSKAGAVMVVRFGRELDIGVTLGSVMPDLPIHHSDVDRIVIPMDSHTSTRVVETPYTVDELSIAARQIAKFLSA